MVLAPQGKENRNKSLIKLKGSLRRSKGNKVKGKEGRGTEDKVHVHFIIFLKVGSDIWDVRGDLDIKREMQVSVLDCNSGYTLSLRKN